MFIVIEGQDATGKDTQAELLKKHLEKEGKTVVLYAESGTKSPDPFVAEIAKLNYGSEQDIDNRTRVLLYLVNRYEQWRKLAEPALKNGDVVITTRSWLSTLIYEGYGAGVSKTLITKLHKTVLPPHYFSPDKSVIFTLTDDERAARLAKQSDEKLFKGSDANRGSEHWKTQPTDFQQKINAAYLKVAKDHDIPTLSAAGTPEEVHQRLKTLFGL